MTFALSFARRAMEQLIGEHGESHDAFPATLLSGMQDPAGASSAALQELDDYMHRFFAFDLGRNFFIQMAVAGACIAVLLIVGGATIISRILQKSFWLFKATRRSEGVYIVPNALNAFLIFEGAFACVWITFIIVQWKAYRQGDGDMQSSIGTLNLIIWWPLWIGAFMAGWGSFYTAPGALDKGPLRSNSISRFLARPLLINIFCFGTPVILIVSLIPLIVLTQQHLNDAFSVYQQFSADIQAAVAAAASSAVAVTPQQAAEFLARANTVWDMQVDTAYYMAIGYAIWPIWAALFLLFYMPAGGYLVYLVWTQVRRQKATLDSLRQRMIEDEALERKRRESAAMDRAQRMFLANNPKGFLEDNDNSVGAVAMRQIITIGENRSSIAPADPAESLLFQPLTSSQERETTAVPEQGVTPPVTPSTAVNARLHGGDAGTDSRAKSDNSDGEKEMFFPALRPELRKRVTSAALRRTGNSASGSPYARYKYLRRCFINLTILYVAIVLGAALYLGVSASLGRWLHESYQRGPDQIAHIVYVACVVTAWGAVVFGSLCVAAILARFIDPANSPTTSRSGEEEKRTGGAFSSNKVRRISAGTAGPSSPFSLRKTAHLSSTGDRFAMQDKTRTLPAVPESVGATMDEMMMSQMSQSSSRYAQYMPHESSLPPRRVSSHEDDDEDNPLDATDDTAVAPRNVWKPRTLKFDLLSRPGAGGKGLFLEPSAASVMDQAMSQVSFGYPDSQTVSMVDPYMDRAHGTAVVPPPLPVPSHVRQVSSPKGKRRGRSFRRSVVAEDEDWEAALPTSSGVHDDALGLEGMTLDAPAQPSRPLAPERPPPLSTQDTLPPSIPPKQVGPVIPTRRASAVHALDSLANITTPIRQARGRSPSYGMAQTPISPSRSTPPTRPPRSATRQMDMQNALLAGLPVSAPDMMRVQTARSQHSSTSDDSSEYDSPHDGQGIFDEDVEDGDSSDDRGGSPMPGAFRPMGSFSFGPELEAKFASHRKPVTISPLTIVPGSPLMAAATLTSLAGPRVPPSTATVTPVSPVRMTATLSPSRRTGLPTSPSQHPPPTLMLPPVPTLRMHTERQTVPSPTKAWKPVGGAAGWHRVPEAQTQAEAGEVAEWRDQLLSPRRPSMPLPDFGSEEGGGGALPSYRRQSEGGVVVFEGMAVDEYEDRRRRRRRSSAAVPPSDKRRSTATDASGASARLSPGTFF